MGALRASPHFVQQGKGVQRGSATKGRFQKCGLTVSCSDKYDPTETRRGLTVRLFVCFTYVHYFTWFRLVHFTRISEFHLKQGEGVQQGSRITIEYLALSLLYTIRLTCIVRIICLYYMLSSLLSSLGYHYCHDYHHCYHYLFYYLFILLLIFVYLFYHRCYHYYPYPTQGESVQRGSGIQQPHLPHRPFAADP